MKSADIVSTSLIRGLVCTTKMSFDAAAHEDVLLDLLGRINAVAKPSAQPDPSAGDRLATVADLIRKCIDERVSQLHQAAPSLDSSMNSFGSPLTLGAMTRVTGLSPEPLHQAGRSLHAAEQNDAGSFILSKRGDVVDKTTLAALEAQQQAARFVTNENAKLSSEVSRLNAILSRQQHELDGLRTRVQKVDELEAALAGAKAEAQRSNSEALAANQRAEQAVADVKARFHRDIAGVRHQLALADGERQRMAAIAGMTRMDYDKLAAVAMSVEAREQGHLRTIAELRQATAAAAAVKDAAVQRQAAAELKAADAERSAVLAEAHAEARTQSGLRDLQVEVTTLRAQCLDAQQRGDLLTAQVEAQEGLLSQARTRIEELERLVAASDSQPVKAQAGPVVLMDGMATAEDEHDSLSFSSVEAFLSHCRRLGMTTAQLVIGIDCTKSNLWSGKVSYNGRPLHDVSDPVRPNPYQHIMGIVGRALKDFDDDGLIPLFGFGDSRTTDLSVFSFTPDGRSCDGIDGALKTYADVMPTVNLAGPTSFAPVIRKTMEIVKKDRQFTVLLIICDGQVTDVKNTESAIVDASKLPIAIVCVGVGDGPWHDMNRFDDGLPARKVDNFQFIELNKVLEAAAKDPRPLDDFFTLSALAELPVLIKSMKKARIL